MSALSLAARPGYRKYHNQPTEYNGVRYSSRLEASYARHLDNMIAAGVVTDWQGQRPRIALCTQRGVKICTYVPDFTVNYADGHTEVVDTKGTETDVFKLKKKWAEADWFPEHPEYGTGIHVVKAGQF